MKNMGRRTDCQLCAIAITGLIACRLGAQPQNAAALTARLHDADSGSSLESADLKPWHLKLEVQLFDSKGKQTEEGTFEAWWAAPDRYRLVYTLPSYNSTEVSGPEGLLRSKDAATPPMNLQAAVEEILHPIHQPEEIEQSQPDLRKQTFGKVALDCIMLDRPVKQVAYPPLGLFPTYCLDPGSTTIRASFDYGTQTTLHNQLGRFQGKTVATDVTVMSGPSIAAKARVLTLQTAKPEEAQRQPSDVLEQLGSSPPPKVSGSVMADRILSKVTPIYPERAKQNHSSGAVVLRAIIGRDGRIHSLRLESYPDPDLAIAAIAGVRQWVYKPYVLNGVPTEVDTKVTVNFQFGPA